MTIDGVTPIPICAKVEAELSELDPDEAAEYLETLGLERPGLEVLAQAAYQLLGLQDYSGQGTALVGLVDAFWDSKGLTSESYFRQFCAPVVPLARFGKATWTADETFVADIEIANYYKDDISNRKMTWTLTDTGGNRIAGGNLQAATLQITSPRNEPTDVDGQRGAQFPLDVRCLPGLLRVVCPPKKADNAPTSHTEK